MSEYDNSEVGGVSIPGLALRLEDEDERACSHDPAYYRARRNLGEAEELPYLSGLEVGRAWASEAASGAALAAAWRIAEGVSTRATIADLDASVAPWLAREAGRSQRESRTARFSPEMFAASSSDVFVWRSGHPFVWGIIDTGAAIWDALQRQDPERAEALADPTSPANRAAYLATLEDERRPQRSRG